MLSSIFLNNFIFRSNQIWSYSISTHETLQTTKLKKQDLHIFIPKDDKNITDLVKFFQKRPKSSQEFWLIDISFWNTLDSAYRDFSQLKLALNVDFYLYMIYEHGFSKPMIHFWEIYQIHELMPKSIFYLGKWSENYGIEIQTPNKWDRRKDLQVKLHSVENQGFFCRPDFPRNQFWSFWKIKKCNFCSF